MYSVIRSRNYLESKSTLLICGYLPGEQSGQVLGFWFFLLPCIFSYCITDKKVNPITCKTGLKPIHPTIIFYSYSSVSSNSFKDLFTFLSLFRALKMKKGVHIPTTQCPTKKVVSFPTQNFKLFLICSFKYKNLKFHYFSLQFRFDINRLQLNSSFFFANSIQL